MSIAKRAEKIRQANTENAKREARVGMALKEKTEVARGRVYGLTAQQAGSHHASTVEGRMFLKSVITATQLLALQHYQATLARFSRSIGTPLMSGNPLARYVASEPCAIAAPRSVASVELARVRFEAVEDAIKSAGTKAVWAISCVCRRREELPEAYRAAFLLAVQALVAHWLKDIDTRSLSTEKDMGKLELKVGALDTATNVAAARSAVVETQLGYVVESLKRIENRMEANADRKR